MPVYSWMSAPDISSDAAFRKWVQGVYDAFIACGWVQTEDTGQIADISGLTVPGTTNTPAGYHVFARDDDLQATCPVVVRVEYGRGASPSGNSPVMWFTVGQGSDGSGTITSVLLDRMQTHTLSAAGSVAERPSYASCDGHGFALALWAGYTGGASVFFAMDRSRTDTGDATGDGVLLCLGCGQTANRTVLVVGNGGGGGVATAKGSWLPVMLPQTINNVVDSAGSTLSEDGVTAPVFPIPCAAPGVKPWVSNMLVAVHPGDAGSTSVIQAATINGQVRIYRAWPSFNTGSGLVPTNASSPSQMAWPAIYWEVED